MSKSSQSIKDVLQSVFAWGAILICFGIAYFLYAKVLGAPANFMEGNVAKGHPKGMLGIIYRGGVIVPMLMTIILVLITFIIERVISLAIASGRSGLNGFVRKLQTLIGQDKIEEAIEACDRQKGSLANVVKSALHRYRGLQADTTLAKDQKVLAIQKELEEASALELPLLSKNLVIMSTIASISVLVGLIGTVLGMIKAFAALAQSGTPDAVALANGISEALINTAFGISGSTVAIIVYNFFSTKVDGISFKIDEASFSVVQSFSGSLK